MDSSTHFVVLDYVVFAVLLLSSSLIGLFYGCTGGRQRTAGEFLLGNRHMTTFPIACSLFASFQSAINLLSVPVEIYLFGTQFSLILIAFTLLIPITNYLYLPVFYELEITSINEYLEKRFNKTIRRCGAVAFILQMVLYLAVVIYAPSLALNQVTGVHVWSCVTIIVIVCCLYTIIGGIKAVMWTDVLQTGCTFFALIVLAIQGCNRVGGLQEIIEANSEGGRFEFFNTSLDPHKRLTLWTQTVGGTFTWLAVYATNQTQVQRYLSAKSLSVARRALWWNLLGLWCNTLITIFLGLLLYTYFKDCDPLLAGKIDRHDQLLPLFAMLMFKTLPGLPGLFVAGILSGSLSTLSSGLNALSAITLEDFIRPISNTYASSEYSQRASLIAKVTAFFYGALCLSCILLVENFHTLVLAALSLFGLIGGPLLGLFTLGLFFPWSNSWGSGLGACIGLALSLWIGMGALVQRVSPTTLLLSCDNYTSPALNISSINDSRSLSLLYDISFMWYSVIAFFIVIIAGLLISFITGANDPKKINPKLLSPLARRVVCYLYHEKQLDTQIELQQTT